MNLFLHQYRKRLWRYPFERVTVNFGRGVVKALKKIGYEEDRQRGSHIVLRQIYYPYRRVTVPDHKEVAREHYGQLFEKRA